MVREVSDPDELARLFATDLETHIYGLGDLEEPFWPNSTWYRDGQAVVGRVSTGEPWTAAYAMSRAAPDDTLGLLVEIERSIPSGTWATGPTGMQAAISNVRRTSDAKPHWRMVLADLANLDASVEAVPLTGNDVDALTDLHASDAGGAFFFPALLANPFVGVWEEGRLVASAGTHVASRRHGVAAIGAVITRPSHRGRGLGTAVMSALCRCLVEDYETVGLNVETANETALRIYDRLGFRRVFQYEEVELL